MSTDRIIIRGYGGVFDQVAIIDGIAETIAPGAFDTSRCWDVKALWGTHEGEAFARTQDHSLSIFQDDYGLGFEMRLAANRPGVLSIQRAIDLGEVTRASVNFCHIEGQEADGRRRIGAARIDHIALVWNAAYEGTGVWLAEAGAEALPPRLADLAQRWERGFQAHNRQQTSHAPLARSGQRTAPRPVKQRPSPLVLARIDALIVDGLTFRRSRPSAFPRAEMVRNADT